MEIPDDCVTNLTPQDDDEVSEMLGFLAIYKQLGPKERKIINLQLKRLLDGQKQYGEWTDDDRDLKREAAEEALDMAHYLAALLV
jgi:hypothetical protein